MARVTNKFSNARIYEEDLTFNGSDTSKNVDVSSQITDARKSEIQLMDAANDYERIFCRLKDTSISNVKIETSPALPAGTYRLLVIQNNTQELKE